MTISMLGSLARGKPPGQSSSEQVRLQIANFWIESRLIRLPMKYKQIPFLKRNLLHHPMSQLKEPRLLMLALREQLVDTLGCIRRLPRSHARAHSNVTSVSLPNRLIDMNFQITVHYHRFHALKRSRANSKNHSTGSPHPNPKASRYLRSGRRPRT